MGTVLGGICPEVLRCVRFFGFTVCPATRAELGTKARASWVVKYMNENAELLFVVFVDIFRQKLARLW